MEINYIINRDTYAIYSAFDNKGYENSLVVEEDRTLQVNKSPMEIVEDSYQYICSDYKGAVRGSRAILRRRNQVPIVFSATSGIVLIPCPTTDQLGKVWLVNSHIYDLKPFEENFTTVRMKNGHSINVGVKFSVIHEKCIHASYLQIIAQQRQP